MVNTLKKKSIFSARKRSGITGNSAISLVKDVSGGVSQLQLASKHTRQIIRTHHTLLKQQTHLKNELKKEKKVEKIREIQMKIEQLNKDIADNGGIDEYQKASIAGQSSSRGGDTSKILTKWLEESYSDFINSKPYSLLEVGCLSARNEVSKCGLFEPIERIDLNSQNPEYIKQQDFMKRPLPVSESEKFDFISLSLVVNYVPDHFERGEMLKRTVKFLKDPSKANQISPLPGLFFVLPTPCVNNSRYFSEERLLNMMKDLGYCLEKKKETAKLAYWLFRLVRKSKNAFSYKREEINPGGKRNNFSICIR